ncbi:MAG: DNA-formamidopyrimidine glycosylase family protein [Anaerolineales bacterium]|jgi:formamidopyrimidine-DNA glycosylase
MPELPEIYLFARDMKAELVGKTIAGVEILQPKCLNVPPEVMRQALTGATILDAGYHGKWVQLETSNGWLLLNLGMGGDLLLVSRDTLPEKRRVIIDFDDDTCLSINFWWFGYVHWVKDLGDHRMTAKLGPNALDLDQAAFHELLDGRRGAVKTFLLNQVRIAGIGNVTVQDPLFRARIHPLRTIDTLNQDQISALYGAIQHTLQEAIDHGGSAWERNLRGEKGRWDSSFFSVAYKEGKPCPECGATIEKIKTGSTSGYVCPQCQASPT